MFFDLSFRISQISNFPAFLRVRAAIGVEFIGKDSRFLEAESSEQRVAVVVLRCIILFTSIYNTCLRTSFF